MRTIALVLVFIASGLAIGACGEDENGDGPMRASDAGAMREAEAAPKKERPSDEGGKGATITLGESEFGSMLFDSRKQAIYVFENDRPNRTVCYGECAEAWPPVYTEGAPRAGHGVDASLLGTIERRDGRRQVTYAGKPLYFYAHEGPGEVRCHNVDLNGGFWWVVGPDGEHRPA
jgi:predicted lipoprotein with Yx(FWY)xxD motif